MAERNYVSTDNDYMSPVVSRPGHSSEVSVVDSSTVIVTDPRKNTMVGFSYDKAVELMPNDMRKQYLAEVKKSVDIDNPATIREFGQELIRESEKISNAIISKSESDPMIPIIGLTNELMLALDDYTNPLEKPKAVSKWKRLPIIRNFVKKAKEVKIESRTPSKNLDEISSKFVAMKSDAMMTNNSIADMGETCRDCVVDSREKIIGLMLMREELQQQIREIDSSDVCDLDELQRLRSRDRELSKRITSLGSSEGLFQQNMVQANRLQRNYDGVIDKCEESLQLIPVVKMQVAMGLEIEKQHRSITALQQFEDYVNKAITTNANTLRDQSIELAKMTEKPMLHVESIDDAKKAIIDMHRGCEQASQEGERVRTEIRSALQKMEEELHEELRKEYV